MDACSGIELTLLLTAKSLTSQKVEGIRMGADVYLTKPFDVELLKRASTTC